jgi:hypothetical protein
MPLLRPREGSHIFGGIMMTLVIVVGYFNFQFATTGGWGPGPQQLPASVTNHGTTSSPSSSSPSSSSPPSA